jgi:hypothetical protein
MATPKELHNRAMDSAEEGFAHKKRGAIADALECFRRAFSDEEAALNASKETTSRAILFDSLMNIRATITELEQQI